MTADTIIDRLLTEVDPAAGAAANVAGVVRN